MFCCPVPARNNKCHRTSCSLSPQLSRWSLFHILSGNCQRSKSPSTREIFSTHSSNCGQLPKVTIQVHHPRSHDLIQLISCLTVGETFTEFWFLVNEQFARSHVTTFRIGNFPLSGTKSWCKKCFKKSWTFDHQIWSLVYSKNFLEPIWVQSQKLRTARQTQPFHKETPPDLIYQKDLSLGLWYCSGSCLVTHKLVFAVSVATDNENSQGLIGLRSLDPRRNK